MFLRFTTTLLDRDSKKPQGVFQSALQLLASEKLSQIDWKHLRELLNWFNEHLPIPSNQSVTRRATFWFKSDGVDSSNRIWEIVHLLREHDYHVVVYKCRRLGNICYEDRLQVAAYPSERDGRVTIY